MSRFLLSLSLFVVGLLNTIPASAQEDTASELYGYGVHAYYSKTYAEAFELLNQSIEHSAKDPRAFYFRGLSQHKLGRADEAKGDFQHAAELEILGTDRKYNISVSLERVQGTVRLEIEKARRQARVTVRSAKRKQDEIKYQSFKAAESAALLDTERPPTAPVLPDEVVADPSDPFANKGAAPADAPAEVPPVDDAVVGPKATEPADPVDPFAVPGDEPKKTEAPKSDPDDPFAIPGDAPAKAAPPKSDPDDPFAVPGDAPAKAAPPKSDPDDPFAVPGDTKPAPPADTAGAPAGNGKRRGALGGIFRSFGNLLPDLPAVPKMQSSPEGADLRVPGPAPENISPDTPADPFEVK